MGVLRVCQVSVAVALVSAFATRVSAAPVDACVAPEIVQQLSACGQRGATREEARPEAPSVRLPGASRARERRPASAQDAAPGYALQDEARTGQKEVERRKRSLLEREVVLVERLQQRGRPGDAHNAKALRRLAQLYFELSKERERAGRQLDGPIHDSCKAKKKGARCAKLRSRQKEALSRRDEARQGNVRALALLLRNHPRHEQADEVLFALGFALEEMGQRQRARKVYHRLIHQYPQSSHVPRAYLSFAEHYFHTGEMDAARRFYEKVAEIPPERNPVHGYALYKQAWCHYNLGDFRKALQMLVETIELAQGRPEDRQLAPLMSQARKELVLPYAQSGRADKALRFFGRYARDAKQARQMYGQLGQLYFDLGRWSEARAVYHGLMTAAPDSPELCRWQLQVTRTVLTSGAKPAQALEVIRLVDLYRARDGRPEPEQAACRDAAAGTLVELAVAWHREAIGTDTQPGTGDDKTMALAAKLYDLTLEHFEDLRGVEFAHIDPRDRPTRYKLSYYRAELAWQMEQHAACGPAFDRVLSIDPRGELTEDAAYGAVLCYDRVYRSRYKPVDGKALDSADAAERLQSRELTGLEQAMLAAFARYLCYVPGGSEALRIQYRRARIYYEANQFERASVLFRQVAFERGDDALSEIAANLYLDSLNALGMTRPGRQQLCHASMEEALDPLAKLHCPVSSAAGEPSGAGHDGSMLCEVVDQLRCQLMRKRAEGLADEGRHRDAGGAYVTIARAHRKCGGRDEVLYNAAIHFEAARLIGRAIKVRKVLVDHHPESPWAMRARYLLGSSFHALALYDRAAEHYEDFARRHPSERGARCTDVERAGGLCPNATSALSDAIFFRLGLGDEAGAQRAAVLFEKSYRRRDPRASSRIRFALGSIYERQGDPKAIARHYRTFLRDYGRHAMPHEVLEAHLKVGRSLSQQGDHRRSPASFAAVLKNYQKLGPRLEALKDISPQERERFAALARMAAAEASFHQGEQARRKFEAIGFPKLHLVGPKSKRAAVFKRWLDGDFEKWIADKGGALTRAKEVYHRVDALKAPPWSIAAAARVGDMYLIFVDAFRDAPVPPELERDEELIDIYYEAIDRASAPWVEQAKQAYSFCLETATRVRWFNDHLSHCEQELFALDPRSYPKAAELRVQTPLAYTAVAHPSPHSLSRSDDGAGL